MQDKVYQSFTKKKDGKDINPVILF